MIATINKAALLQALTAVSGAMKRTMLPETEAVKLTADAKNSVVLVTATSIDLWSIESIPQVKIGQDGSCLINAKLLKELLSSFQGEEIQIESDDKSAAIRSPEQGSVWLAVMDPAVFPVSPEIGNRQHLVSDLSSLRRLVMALPSDDSRMNLFGVVVEPGADRAMRCYASNGRVAASAALPIEGKLTGGLFIPAPCVSQISALGRVAITKSGNWIVFESERNTTLVKGLSVEPMSISSFINNLKYNATAVVDRESLLAKLRSIHCLRKAGDSHVVFQLKQSDRAIIVAANNSCGSVSTSTVCKPGGAWSKWGEAMFPTDNFVTFLSQSDSDMVKLLFGEPHQPVCIEDGDCSVHIMPMRRS